MTTTLDAWGYTVTITTSGPNLIFTRSDGVVVTAPATEAVAQVITAFSGMEPPGFVLRLADAQAIAQATLDALFTANFDLAAFIRGGSAVGITATQVGTFLATIANNYRGLRASIAAASTVAAVQAINVAGGWPGNP
jgi:hypothetical protein